jgi:hypothetical protein
MTKRLGIREITRNFSVLEEFDYVEVEDKKTHHIKGLFVSVEFLDAVKALINQKIEDKKKRELEAFSQYVGMVNGEFGDLTVQEIKASKKEKYNGL